jgi:hypothetical protein
MYKGNTACSILRYPSGIGKEETRPDACASAASNYACFEPSQMRIDFSYWFGQKFDNLRLGPLSTIRLIAKSKNFDSRTNSWSRESNGF